jgi:hypothetical protein
MKGIRSTYKYDIRACQIHENIEGKRNRATMKQHRYFSRRWFMRTVLHPYGLMRGNEKFPRTEWKTIFGASQDNRHLENEWWKRQDEHGDDRGGPLWRWRIVDYKEKARKLLELYDAFEGRFATDEQRRAFALARGWTLLDDNEED